MGFIKDVFGGLFGKSGKDAAEDAADAQYHANTKALRLASANTAQIRQDFEPYRQAGIQALPNLTGLSTSPQFQYDYIKNNPFYKLMADDAWTKLSQNKAAEGKLGSGGTAIDMQNRLLLLGRELIDKDIGNLRSLAGMGYNASAGQADATQNFSNTQSNIITNQGNIAANGIVGGFNAQRGALTDLMGFGASLFGLGGGGSKSNSPETIYWNGGGNTTLRI